MNSRLSLRLTLPLLVSIFTALSFINQEGWNTTHASSNSAAKITQGALVAFDASGKPAGQCPLKHTEVKAEVSGFLSRVTVTQEFENPFEEKIEAVYTFPLPQAAAVDDMTMVVGERTIKGKIMQREEAKAAYTEAKSKGQIASLLDQERPNIFTQSVANIMVGQPIKVTISYVETLKYDEGSYEWSFPMVVGPRYNPVSSEAQPAVQTSDENSSAPDASQVTTPALPDETRAGHDISIEVSIDAGVPIDALKSETHEIESERPDERRAIVRLKDKSTIPNKDFVLKYDVAGRQIADGVLTHRAGRDGYFTLILQPPERVTVEDVTPKELVFVLDTSGSMQGFPLEKAKETMMLALDGLYPQDTFNLITFSGDTEILFSKPVPATPENIQKAKKFLEGRQSDGGTEMMKAIRAALKPSDEQDHIRITCFMTDGQVGNDMEIIGEVQKYQNARVFAMGFGYAANRFLLDKMAEYGRGEVEYVTEAVDSSNAARRFHQRVREPLLTDITVEYEGLTVAEVYPQRIPDLFSAKPLILTGRYARGGRGVIRLKGRMSGREFVRDVTVEFPENEPQHDVLATLWARRKIDDLMGQDMQGLQTGKPRDELRMAITQLGLDYRLMTQFTSFVAIEEAVTTDGGEPRRVEVPAYVTSSVVPPGAFMGSATSMVMMSSSSSGINATSASVTRTVEPRDIDNLPLRGRSQQALLETPAGIVPAGANNPADPSQYRISVNGQRPSANSFTVDGVSANIGIAPGGQAPGASAAGTMPGLTVTGGLNGLASLGATKELTIRTFVIDPQYSRVPGGQFEMSTRDGTNEFHGSLFEYFGNDALDANDWFANSRSLPQPARRLNDFGGTFAGPIRKDQTFFFASYEGLRLRQPMTVITDVPSLNARRLAPLGLQPFLQAYPLPTGAETPDGFAEFAASYANPARMDAGSLRIDQMFGNQLKVTARYNYAVSSAGERGTGGSSLNTMNDRSGRIQTLTGSASYIATPNVVIELGANYSRFAIRSSYGLDQFGGATLSTAPGLFASLFSTDNLSSSFDLGGRNSALMAGSEAASVQRQINMVGSTTIISGNHTLKFGADYRRLSPIIGLRTFDRRIYFNGVDQSLTGIATRIGNYTRAGTQRPVFNNLSVYAQDEWKITQRLTLTYGLRWEVNPAPTAGDGQDALAVNQFDDVGQLRLAPRGTRLWKTTYNNFAPRFGLAYQLSQASNRELVLRGGLGIFYDLGNEQAGHAFADSYPFLAGESVFNSALPATLLAAAPPALGSNLPTVVPFAAFDPKLKLPYTLRWHVSLEQALGSSQTISAAYIGAAGRRLLLTETLLDRNPDFSFVRLTSNGAKSDYQSLQLQFSSQSSRGLLAVVSYTLSKSIDDYTQDSASWTILRGDDKRMERGPSDFDVRQVLAGFISYNLPSPLNDGPGNSLLRNWTIGSVFNARSARSVNVVYGFPTTFGFAYLRPDLVSGVPLYLNDPAAAGGRRINPDAFAVPASLRQGTSGRNSLRGFPLYQIDLALQRRFNFNERVNLQFKMEAINLFNHPNFDDPSGNGLSLGTRLSPSDTLRPMPGFGSSAYMFGRNLWGVAGNSFSPFYQPGGSRTFQFALKLEF
jgi:Ca-activated chloride channel family protein